MQYVNMAKTDVMSFISMPENPRLLSLGMNGILSKRSQVEPGEAEYFPT